jgi:hypothetical protein
MSTRLQQQCTPYTHVVLVAIVATVWLVRTGGSSTCNAFLHPSTITTTTTTTTIATLYQIRPTFQYSIPGVGVSLRRHRRGPTLITNAIVLFGAAVTDDDDTTTTVPSENDTIDSTNKKSTSEELYNEMNRCLTLLNIAATTKQIDSDLVYEALCTLERVARQCNKLTTTPPPPPTISTTATTIPSGSTASNTTTTATETYAYGQQVYHQLSGSWQLIFTTGTAKTQSRLGGAKINYFPLKAVQTFDTATNVITNAIYIGNWKVIQFSGTFTFDVLKCKLEFDFDSILLFQTIPISLKPGQAAEMGAASGLGSESNVKNIKEKQKMAFFNWISADTTIATARGGGGGLALWKRI